MKISTKVVLGAFGGILALWIGLVVLFQIQTSRYGWLDSPGSVFENKYPLYAAISRSDVGEMRRLLERDPILAKMAGSTNMVLPLVSAVRVGNPDVVNVLLEYGADPNKPSDGGMSPLHFAAQWGYADVAETLIKHGAQVNARDVFGATPLHYAASRGYPEKNSAVIKVLLENGADINLKDNYGDTALTAAEKHGFKQAANQLRERDGQVK
jgi:ankyrin repeat protein